jgi:molecular chaperone GrpE
MLTGPGRVLEEVVEATPAVEDAAREVRVSDLRAVIEGYKARASDLETAVEDWKARASGLQVEVEDLRALVADLQDVVEDRKALLPRLQNQEAAVRRRIEHRAQQQIQEERARLLNRLLGVADNLERALAHAATDDPLRAGVQLTLHDLINQMAQEGVEPIQALGQPFDPNLHEAVATDGTGGDRVVKVVQTGYTLDGELLRPARVVVGRVKA